jgi:hypothetical protein
LRKRHCFCLDFFFLLQKALSICARFFSHQLLCLSNFGSSSNLYQWRTLMQGCV